MTSRPTRRRFGGVLAVAGLSLLGGCLTTDIGIQAPGIEDSTVFSSVSRTESWATSTTRAKVTLRPQATRKLGVTELIVMKDGSSYYTTTLKPTATSAEIVLPTTGSAVVVAVDSDGNPIDQQEMRVTGSRWL
ncbi:hypothetical protein [Haloarchaeobius sp. TZWWS8]|uniref:hypothetical protein n=1 Tax=Haloarchaeobius sp. TZWWS8 TaxID=3446121 RepID=UPI003EC03C6D